MICIPGIPIKRDNPCVDPLQGYIPHIVKAYGIVKDRVVFKKYVPNIEDYPEYEYIIQMFIDSKLN